MTRMHTTTLFVASVALLSTIAIAEPQRPKFYFPRQIKRQVYYNSTVTTAPQQTSQERLSSSSSPSSSSSSTKRDLSDFLDSITGQYSTLDPAISSSISSSSSSAAVGTGGLPGSSYNQILPAASKSSSSYDESTRPTKTSTPDPTTSTGFLGFITTASATASDTAPTGTFPSAVVLPTTSPSSSDSSEPESKKPATTYSADRITFGPGGILTDESTTRTKSDSSSYGVSFSGSAGSTDVVSSAPTTTTESAKPTFTPDGILPIGKILSSALVIPTSTSEPIKPTSEPTNTSAEGSSAVTTTANPTTTSKPETTTIPLIDLSSILATGSAPTTITEPVITSSAQSTPKYEPTPTFLSDLTSRVGTGLLLGTSSPPSSTVEGTGSSITPVISASAEPTPTSLIDLTSLVGTGFPTSSTFEGTGSSITPVISASAEPTGTSSPTTDLRGILSSILGTAPELGSATSTSKPVTTTPEPSATLLPQPSINSTIPNSSTLAGTGATSTPTDVTSLPPTGTGTGTTSGSITTSDPVPTDTVTGPITSGAVTTSPPIATPTDITTSNSTSISNTDVPETTSSPFNGSEITSLPTSLSTSLPAGSASVTLSASDTTPTTTASTTNATEPAVPQTSAPPTTSGPIETYIPSLPSTTPAPTTTSVVPQTIAPISTNSDKSLWLPTTIIAASSLTLPMGQTYTARPTGISNNLPRVITNPDATAQPEDTTQIQLGFLFPLNYKFVVENPMSSAQIFEFLPQGIADGLGLKKSQIIMHSLVPLDTTQTTNYITTLALAYIPSNMVRTLALDLHIPTSALYNNDQASVKTLMNYINPAIPLNPGSNMEPGGSTGTSGSTEPSSSLASGNSVFGDTEEQNQSPGKTGATAGIAMAAIGGSAAYGAAMFLIARRYKKRKQSHRRSSSVLHGGEMRQSGSPALMGGGALMSGGRTTPGYDRHSSGSGRTGNSARTQQISAPMMAENSLGWN